MVKNEMRQFWLQSFAFWERGVSFKQRIDGMDLLHFGCKSIAFWLQSVFFKQQMDRMDFQKLFEVREMANSLYSLALENNLGDKVKNLLENLGNGGHGIALQKLKDKFGIIRESLKGTSVRCTHGSNAYALFYGSF